MRADRRDPIIASLRRFKPHRFEVKLRDGTSKQVPLSTKTNRWELLSDTLNVLPWSTIEALDDQGQVLGAIEREGVEEEIEVDREVERAEAITRIMLSAISTAMSETRKMFADTMKANAEMCKAMLESQHVVVESYQLALKVQASAMLQPPDADGDDKMMEMFKMAMMLRAGGSPTIAVTPPPPKPAAKPAAPVTNGKG